MTKWLFALITVLSMALAQTNSRDLPLTTYYADELERTNGMVYVSAEYNTLLWGFGKLEMLTAANPNRIDSVRLSESMIQLNVKDGVTDGRFGMTLLINGRPVQLIVQVVPGFFNRTVRIEAPRYAVTRQNQIATVNAPAEPPATPPPSQTNAPRPTTPAPRPAAATPTSTPATATPAPAPLTPAPAAAPRQEVSPQNNNLPFAFKAELVSSSNGMAFIQYTVLSFSDQPLSLEVSRLFIKQNGRDKEFSLTRVPTAILVEPKGMQAGTIAVQDLGTGEVTLEWAVVEITPNNPAGKTHYLRRSLNGVGIAESTR